MPDRVVAELVIGLLAFITGGGAVAWYRALKGERRDDRRDDRAERESDVDQVARLMDRMATNSERLAQVYDELATVREEAAHAQRDATAATEQHAETQYLVAQMRSDFAVVVRDATPLVAWLDAGATPPPPEVSDQLRRVLRQRGAHEATTTEEHL